MEVARPDVVRGVRNHPRAIGIELDVALHSERVAIRIDDAREVAPLPQRTRSPLMPVEAWDVLPTDALDRSTDAFTMAARDEQVEVVAHQDVRMNGHPMLLRRFAQQMEELQPVAIAREKQLSAVGANDDV